MLKILVFDVIKFLEVFAAYDKHPLKGELWQKRNK